MQIDLSSSQDATPRPALRVDSMTLLDEWRSWLRASYAPKTVEV